jgi:hypothetical protein
MPPNLSRRDNPLRGGSESSTDKEAAFQAFSRLNDR